MKVAYDELMNALPTRFIILLLFVLQGFAPLVHAHMRVNNTVSGVHVNGFSSDNLERLTTVMKNSDDNPAIELGDAIQKKQNLVDDCGSQYLFFDTFYSLKIGLLIKNNTLDFSIPIIYPSHFLFLSTSAPRAPPFGI